MSKHKLVDAYVSGTINRRAFVRGLTALGVGAGLAASYAVALQPAVAAQGCNANEDYDHDLGCVANPPGGMSGADADGDGLYNWDEVNVYGTGVYAFDTDGDGTSDGAEVYYGTNPLGVDSPVRVDSDYDGLYDVDETNVYYTNPYNYDSDGDGVSDGTEVYYGTNP